MSRLRATVLLLLIGACSQPDYTEIQREFESAHPGCTVSMVAPGEGDSDNVYVHIKYKCPRAATEVEEVWLYQRTNGEWRKGKQVPSAGTDLEVTGTQPVV